MYTFQTSRGQIEMPNSEGIDGERRKLPQQKTSFGVFQSLKKTHLIRHKSIIFDISGRPRGLD